MNEVETGTKGDAGEGGCRGDTKQTHLGVEERNKGGGRPKARGNRKGNEERKREVNNVE